MDGQENAVVGKIPETMAIYENSQGLYLYELESGAGSLNREVVVSHQN